MKKIGAIILMDMGLGLDKLLITKYKKGDTHPYTIVDEHGGKFHITEAVINKAKPATDWVYKGQASLKHKVWK